MHGAQGTCSGVSLTPIFAELRPRRLCPSMARIFHVVQYCSVAIFFPMMKKRFLLRPPGNLRHPLTYGYKPRRDTPASSPREGCSTRYLYRHKTYCAGHQTLGNRMRTSQPCTCSRDGEGRQSSLAIPHLLHTFPKVHLSVSSIRLYPYHGPNSELLPPS